MRGFMILAATLACLLFIGVVCAEKAEAGNCGSYSSSYSVSSFDYGLGSYGVRSFNYGTYGCGVRSTYQVRRVFVGYDIYGRPVFRTQRVFIRGY